ncbi:MAG: helix-turn-helix domain-containing protein [Cetobacterium sp.]|uniref:helix-turn-helix domain-containing protein n=1 Tax=Cetobacterium sp. TaxID=2071632 RepID=UPI003EE6FD64
MKLDVGKKLKQMRNVKGMTLEQAGNALGVIANAISRYENNTMTPRFETIEKMCNVYGYKIMIVPKGTKVVQPTKKED